jgi:cytoskeletal protein CcmA (bactofilin family)
MSDPRGVSDLTKEDSCLDQSFALGEFADSLSRTSSYFETWLENLKPAPASSKNAASQYPLIDDGQRTGEFRFEGNLRVDGYANGLIRSLTGTLILGEAAEVVSEVIVATVIIDGCLRGDVHATKRVELLSHAKVIGNIESPAIVIQPGAVFEGECHFLRLPDKSDSGDSDGEEGRLMEPLSLAPGFSHGSEEPSASTETV